MIEYIPRTAEEEQQMLSAIGVSSFDALLDIPEALRLRRPLNLPEPLSQMELWRHMETLAHRNQGGLSFLGAGSYDHYIPSPVRHVLSRSEFATAYTPYQAEMSQGLLQTIYEYQTMICRLTGMQVANASVYDGASALAEAALMTLRITGRKEILILGSVHPHHLQVVETYLSGLDDTACILIPHERGHAKRENLKQHISTRTAAVLVQHPNFFGQLEDLQNIESLTHAQGAMLVMSVNPISLGIIKSPGEYGADIAVGEGQGMGNPISYGGPYVGFFATRRDWIRQVPGRLVARTIDTHGKPGFCLTLQTREQHIRREKATSNICTNQALNALASAVYLATVGKEGLQEVARLCFDQAHRMFSQMMAKPGYQAPFSRPFFNEFVIQPPTPVSDLLARLEQAGIFGGIDLGHYDASLANHLLVCVTEKHTQEDIDRFLACL